METNASLGLLEKFARRHYLTLMPDEYPHPQEDDTKARSYLKRNATVLSRWRPEGAHESTHLRDAPDMILR